MPEETAAAGNAGDQPAGVTTFADDGDLIQEPPTPARESPDPGAEAGEAEPQEAAGQEEAAEGEAAEGAQSEEPSIEDVLQELTQREAAYYQKRYPSAWKKANDPNAPEDERQILIDKINSDREIQRLSAAQEPTLEGEEGEEEAEAPPPPVAAVAPEEQQKQYREFISGIVARRVNPDAVKAFGTGLLEQLGVDAKVLSDPNASPEAKAEVRAFMDRAPALGAFLAGGVTDLVTTVLPEILPQLMAQTFPEFGEMYERSMFAMTWDRVRNQADEHGELLYPDMPAWGTKEFTKVAREAAKKIPGFDNMVFTDPKTRQVLPPHEQARLKYETLADIISGQRVDPAVVAQAVQTGKRLAAKGAQSRARGRALGSGQTSAAQTPQDDFRASIDAYNAESYSTPRK